MGCSNEVTTGNPNTVVVDEHVSAPTVEPSVQPPPQEPSLKSRLVTPNLDEVVMDSLSNEQICVARFEHCECFKSEANWLCFPSFHFDISKVGTTMLDSMQGKSWDPDCPVAPSDLRVVRVLHWETQEQVRWGELVIAENEAQNIVDIFREIYLARFILPSIRRIDDFDGNDDLSMAANNTSAFNCRKVKGTEIWSQHSYGNAIDLNPLWNPWTRGDIVDPPSGKAFVDRSEIKPGMIEDGDIVVEAFLKRGWKWGGHWKGKKDYQHFSVNGR